MHNSFFIFMTIPFVSLKAQNYLEKRNSAVGTFSTTACGGNREKKGVAVTYVVISCVTAKQEY